MLLRALLLLLNLLWCRGTVDIAPAVCQAGLCHCLPPKMHLLYSSITTLARRHHLLCLLRVCLGFAQMSGAVLDGRDIGTVICPDAPVKLYVTADVAVRAQRRLDELKCRGGAAAEGASFDAVLADMKARDDRDMNRATAPLKPAADAITLDTTSMSIDQAFAQARSLVEAALTQQEQQQQQTEAVPA